MTKKIFWCKNCLNMSTRPRITFDQRGWCNACQWMEEKKKIDWKFREKQLNELLDKNRSKSNSFDCLVPVSGGKDGSYVTHQLEKKYGMKPLTVTIKPALTLDIGNKNLTNFINSGYNHIHISCNPKVLDRLNKYGFLHKGFPYYGWLVAVQTAVVRIAVNFKIPLIFYGESGEVEYGGSAENKNKILYDIEYMQRVYLDGGHEKIFEIIKKDKDIDDKDLTLFQFPTKDEVSKVRLSIAEWSYFEPWDSYRNYVVAKEHCGLTEKNEGNYDTFTNFAQNDQELYSLHVYLMYLKFGFGRATQDAGIEIRRGSMTRSQALNLVKMYDNAYPSELIKKYLNYYQMSKEEFDKVLDRYANSDLFQKVDGIWKPKFTVGKDFYL